MNLASIAVPGNPDLIFADDSGDFTDNVTTTRTIRIDVPLVNSATPSHEVGQLLQLIDTGFCALSTEAISIDLLDLCNTKHIAISRHPMCGCSW
jgi:hypothetical protein